MDQHDLNIFMKRYGIVFVMLGMFVILMFASPNFLKTNNLINILVSVSINGVLALGMVFVITAGGIDLSVGSVTALAMVAAGWLFLNGVDPWVAAGLAICLTTLVGMAMGFLTTVIGLHHFIVSLGVMVIARGVCLLATGGRPLGLFSLPPEFKFIGQGALGGIPLVLTMGGGYADPLEATVAVQLQTVRAACAAWLAWRP